jgi:hypothetical protein
VQGHHNLTMKLCLLFVAACFRDELNYLSTPMPSHLGCGRKTRKRALSPSVHTFHARVHRPKQSACWYRSAALGKEKTFGQMTNPMCSLARFLPAHRHEKGMGFLGLASALLRQARKSHR